VGTHRFKCRDKCEQLCGSGGRIEDEIGHDSEESRSNKGRIIREEKYFLTSYDN